MSIRTVEIPATGQIELQGEVHPVVTLEDLTNALVRAAVVLDMNGGCLSVVQRRIPTTVPNESVTTQALMTWQDRTNAKAQSEPDSRTDPVENGVRPVDDEPHRDVSAGDEFIGPGSPQEPVDDVGDGLVYDPEGEDLSSIPSPLRETVVG